MRLLVDTNIWLDVALNRSAAASSAAFLRLCTAHQDDLWIAWHTIANMDYILKRAKVSAPDRELHLRGILSQARIVPTDESDALRALDLRWNDYEDALQAAAAERCRADCIITGNSPDFSASTIPALSPEAYIARHTKIHSGNGPHGDSQIREKFDRILARVPDAPPQPGDERTD